MPHAGVYVLASLISGVSAALILASGPSYIEPRSPQGAVYNVFKRGQSTDDRCWASPCQTAHINSVVDFCLWAPSQPALSATRHTEHPLVAWCTKSAHGTRLIPDGTISGAHFVTTPEYIQITGVGKLTNINVPVEGVTSASGQGYHLHGLVLTSAYGQLEQISDWTSFVSQERFCFRACKPSAAASAACPQIHDIVECSEVVPGNYDTGVFEDCVGDAVEVLSILDQEVLDVPSRHSASSCRTRGTIGDAHVRRAVPMIVPSLSRPHFRSHSHRTPMSSCLAPTTTDTMTDTFSTSSLNATTFVNTSTPIVSNSPPPCSYNHPRSRWHTHGHGHSHHHSSTSSASPSPSSSSTASSLDDPSGSTVSASSPISSPPSFTITIPTPSDTTSFVTSTSIPASTPTTTTTTSFPSSSFSEPPASSYNSSAPSSVETPTSSSSSTSSSISTTTTTTSSSTSSYISTSTSSQSPYLPILTTPSPASSTSPTSPSTLSSTLSQSIFVFTFTTPSSSISATSPASSLPTIPNSQTQIGSQCPPQLRVVNAGSVVASSPLLSLTLTILMIVITSSVGVLVL